MSKSKTENWEVSDYNWNDEVRTSTISAPDKVLIHDATMRDGAHVVDFTDKERIQLTVALSELGVSRVEIESRDWVIKRQSKYAPEKHWETLKNIANMGLKTEIFTMRLASEGHEGIDEAIKYDVPKIVLQERVQKGRLAEMKQTLDQRIEQVQDVITYAKDRGCYIEWFLNRITLSDLDYLLRMVKAGTDAGADSLCITDSGGLATPDTFAFLVRKFREASGDKIPVAVHPHNDFGLALANGIAGYGAGSSIFHCCINSLGARAGNITLEEAVIGLHVLYDVDLGLDYSKLYDACKLVETMQEWPVAKNKPFNGYGLYSAPYKLQYFGKQPHQK